MSRTSIRRRLLSSFIALAALPLLLVGLVLSWSNYETSLIEAYARQEEISLRLAVQTESYLKRIQQDLEGAILHSNFADAPRPARERVLETLLSKRELYRELLQADTAAEEQLHVSNVRVLVGGHEQPGGAQYEELVRNVIGSGSFSLSQIYYDRTSNEPLLLMASPAGRLGSRQLTAVVVAEIRLYPIWKFISDMQLSPGEDVYILDQLGRVIAHKNPSIVLREQHVELQTGQKQRVGLSGKEVLVSVHEVQIGHRPFRVVVEREVRKALQPVTNNLLVMSIVLLVALAGAVFVSARQARRISEPIISVSEAAMAIRNGSLDRRVEEGSNDEVGDLAKTFNGMTQTLQNTLRKLEEEVQVRVRAEAELQRHQQQLEVLVEERTRALRNQQTFNHAVLDNISDGISACDANGDLTLINRAARDMLGVDREGDLSEPYRSSRYRILSTTDSMPLPDEERPIRRAYRGEQFSNYELMVERFDGRRLTLLASGQPMYDADGKKIGAVTSLRDVSVQKAAEEALLAAKQAAEEASAAKSNFVANMSHELRTPLNAILGMIYLVLRNELPSVVRSQLGKAQSAAHALLGIINDVLDISKIEAGKLEIEHLEFGLDSVLERVVDVVGGLAAQKNVELLIRHDPQIPSVLIGDPLRIGQVLINLCSNAVKFTEKGEVELSLMVMQRSTNEVAVRICVRDTGLGMPPEVRERLFEKFVQADQSTTRRFGGTGLGLAICRELTDRMGGHIWVESSEPGLGSTICLTLPLGIATVADVGHRQDVVYQAGPLLKDVRALVVDDNRAACEILAEMLRELHMQVDLCFSGVEALEMLTADGAGPYDLVLLDWNMPVINGTEALARLRQHASLARQPKVIMVTAYGREMVLKEGTEDSPDGYIVKPVSPSVLLDTILTVLGRTEVFKREENRPLPRGWKHDFTGVRVLLVEDNEINREFAGELLRGEGVVLDEAVDGAQALAKIQQNDYDVVLMDIQMPVMDGLEATRRVRALAQHEGGERFARLPIIAMTALAMSRDVERSLVAGMNDHVTKPIDPEHFMATLGRWAAAPHRIDSVETRLQLRGDDVPPDLRAMTSIDGSAGLARIGGRDDAYRRQLRRFREHYGDADRVMQRLLEEGNLKEAENYCHAFKGVCGNIGAQKLYVKVSEINDVLKHGNIPSLAGMQEMASRLHAVLHDIDGLGQAQDATAGENPGFVLTDAKLQELLKRLAQALEYDLGAAEGVVALVRRGLAGSPWRPRFEAIADSIERFDIAAAMTLLQDLQTQLAAVGVEDPTG